MTTTRDRRGEILERLADHVLAEGLGASSLRPLAAAAGTSDRMLLYYFHDKAELIEATLAHIAARLAVIISGLAGATLKPPRVLRAEMFEIMCSEAIWPYTRLWLEIAAMSARGDPVCRAVGEQIGRGFLAWAAARLDSPEGEREAEAATLLASTEGLLMLHGLGLDDVCRQALR